MAGPDSKLSEQVETTDSTGGYLFIIKPDGGGFVDRKISASNLVTATANARKIDKIVNQSSDDTYAVSAGSKVDSIDFEHVSGTPLIKIGSSAGGVQYSLAEIPVPSSDYLVVAIQKIFSGSSTIYISISGGTVNYNVIYTENYF